MHTLGDGAQDRLTARVYTRAPRPDELQMEKVPGVVYYHGGGYAFGAPDTEVQLCSLVASRLRVVVVHVCYREAPQHPHPAAHNDGKQGFEWVVDNAKRLGIDPEQIVLVGLSCGAGIAASTALRVCNEDAERLRAEAERVQGDAEKRTDEDRSPRPAKRRRTNEDESSNSSVQSWRGTVLEATEVKSSDDFPPEAKVYDRSAPLAGRKDQKARIKGVLLAVPWLMQESSFPYDKFASREATSRVQCAEAAGMSKPVYDRLAEWLGAKDPNDPLLNVPLAKDKELARFPRTALMISGMDFFRDDGLLFGHKLKSLGVPRRLHLFKGMPHGFRKYDDLWSSKRFDELFLLLINWALDRTVSSVDTRAHIEQRELANPPGKMSQESRMQEPPFSTRYSGPAETM
ncbi:Alpha/Beta hydrolase protein [Coniochaeta sp. 2T2.1]|nr:Alpha/Beta hydrolase protein [Coniochaeta sp. 2T2.1]